MSNIGDVLNGRYRLERLLGRGGFSTVFQATDLELARSVAVKILLDHLIDHTIDFRDRFLQEARLAAALEHPNILGVYDFGSLNDTVYIVMPLVTGGTIYDLLRGAGRFEPRRVTRLLNQIADAMDYAHRRQLVHRDIKPQNLLLADGEDRILLADFGIAKLLSGNSNATSQQIVGTMAYMAPEQFHGRISPLIDIYALGCVIFQLLTGECPFTGPIETIMRGHLFDPIPSLSARSGVVDLAMFQPIIDRALAKQPESRFQTAIAFAQAFEAIVSQFEASTAPIEAQPRRSGPKQQASAYHTAPIQDEDPSPQHTDVAADATIHNHPALSPLPRSRDGFVRTLLTSLRSYWRRSIRPLAAAGDGRDVEPLAISTEDLGEYRIVVPLSGHFRFLHEPIASGISARFVGRKDEIASLVLRILYSDGGSFLVTGYRGVGKTSFVNQVIGTLTQKLAQLESAHEHWQIINVQLNIARPLQPAELMHHIIRRLYDELVDSGIEAKLEMALRQELKLAFERTSVNMTRKLAETRELSYGLNEANFGLGALPMLSRLMPAPAVKLSLAAKRSGTRNLETTFLSYDDRAAEQDIIRLSNRLAAGYVSRRGLLRRKRKIRLKIIFVFDELDKLNEYVETGDNKKLAVIDEFLSSLKNLFTTSGISFIFVAGKDLQERWVEDISKGDSIYESVFAFDQYLPCLWANIREISDQLIDYSAIAEANQDDTSECQQCQDHAALGRPYCLKCGRFLLDAELARSTLEHFRAFLYYRGRGIPRRIIREFNNYVRWYAGKPVLVFTPKEHRRIRFYAALQETISNSDKDLLSGATEEVRGTQYDKRRLGLYYLCDWILARGPAEFTFAEVVAASKQLSTKIAPAEKLAPGLIDRLIKLLVDNKYLTEVHVRLDEVRVGDLNDGSNRRYKLRPGYLAEMGLSDEISDDDLLSMEESTQRIGRYELLEEIGTFGICRLLRAWDQQRGKVVAVKLLQKHLASVPQAIERLRREAQVLGSLNHPNVIRLLGSGVEHGQQYIALEYVDGVWLGDILRNEGKLPVALVLSIVKPLVQALDYVHQNGLIRNDVTPASIVLSKEGKVVLADFGITKYASDADSNVITQRGEQVGTPAYMAPELLIGGQIDERADIYSVGVLLYEMLTGRRPFQGSTMTLSSLHLRHEPEPPAQFADMSSYLEKVILRCLMKTPEERYQTMSALFEALDEPASARLPKGNSHLSSLKDQRMDLMSIVELAIAKKSKAQDNDDVHTLNEIAGALLSPGPSSLASSVAVINAPADMAAQAVVIPAPKRDPEAKSGDTEPSVFLRMPHVRILNYSQSLQRIFFLFESTSVGRGSHNDIVLDDPLVSRSHLIIERRDKGYFVTELASANGAKVNGKHFVSSQLLRDGDKIEIGRIVMEFSEGIEPANKGF